MTLHAPQFTMLALLALGLVVHICNHGKPRNDYNGPSQLIDVCIVLAVLYWGGFFGNQ